jgi:acyl dehydratase
MDSFVETYRRPPSALAFMARAFLPSPGLPPGGSLPRIVQRWPSLRIDPAHLDAFRRAIGWTGRPEVPVLYPHVLGFRLMMATLTHRAFPLPIFNGLQVRNRLVRHGAIDVGGTYDFEVRTGAHRALQKGIEVDLLGAMTQGSRRVFDSTVTFFFRARAAATAGTAQALASPGLEGALEHARFTMPVDGGWSFGGLTGDYNGLHWSNRYARAFGFRAAFPHPQRVAGLCLAHLAAPASDAQSLELWIKGPVFYGAEVVLRTVRAEGEGQRFGLSLTDDPRPAFVGEWRAAVAADLAG